MEYRGKYEVFDTRSIETYPVARRQNKVTIDNLVDLGSFDTVKDDSDSSIKQIAGAMIEARKSERPVVAFIGGHFVKNGLSRFIIDLVERDVITLVAGNGSTCIHDFELALIGATSEDVPDALDRGQFGMAAEFSYINTALTVGNEQKIGFGESLGMMIVDPEFRQLVFERLGTTNRNFVHPEVSILAACFRRSVPFTAHVGIGTDVTDQHPSFNGDAKGGCSGRDFLIYAAEIARMAHGGVVLNIGSAVTGPEVLLKAISMSANTGRAPTGIVTADFDIRSLRVSDTKDDRKEGYYYRDQKSVVARIPQAFHGKGFYVEGDQKRTIPRLYGFLIDKMG